MSGGHFDYAYFRISMLAEDLKHEIDTNESMERNEWDEVKGHHFNKETIQILKECHTIIEKAGKLAREIEWLYSGDYGEESFMEVIKPIMDN